MSTQFSGKIQFSSADPNSGGTASLDPSGATLLMGPVGSDKRAAEKKAFRTLRPRFADGESVNGMGTKDPTGNEPAIWVETIQSAGAQTGAALSDEIDMPVAQKAAARKAPTKKKAAKKVVLRKVAKRPSAKKAGRAARQATVKKAAKAAPKKPVAKKVTKKPRKAAAAKKTRNLRKGGRK